MADISTRRSACWNIKMMRYRPTRVRYRPCQRLPLSGRTSPRNGSARLVMSPSRSTSLCVSLSVYFRSYSWKSRCRIPPEHASGRNTYLMLGGLRCRAKVEMLGARIDRKAQAFQTAIQPQETGHVPPVLSLLRLWHKGGRLDGHVLAFVSQ